MPVASGHPQRRWANGREARLWHFCITPAPDFTPHYPEKTRHRFGCAFPRAGRIYWRRFWSPAWKGILFLNVLFRWQLNSASFRPPLPQRSLFPCGGLSLSHPPLIALSWPSPYSCTLIPLDSPWHTLVHARFRILSILTIAPSLPRAFFQSQCG